MAGYCNRFGIRDQVNPKGFDLDNTIHRIANDNPFVKVDNPTGISPGYMLDEKPIDNRYGNRRV